MADRQRHALLGEISVSLKKRGIFTQYQYLHSLQVRDRQLKHFDLEGLLRRYFHSVQRKIIWRNLPPAFVFTCRGRLAPRAIEPQKFALKTGKS